MDDICAIIGWVMIMKCHERIRELRVTHGLTQAFVAAMMDVDRTTYSRYELGKVEIPLACLLPLARYYRVSMDYLAGRTDDPDPSPRARPDSGRAEG